MHATVAYPLESDARVQPVLRSLSDIYTVERAQIERTSATFYDSFDWRLHRRGWILRWSANRRLSYGSLDGDEIAAAMSEEPPTFAWDLPDGTLRKEIGEALGVRRLLPLATATWEERQLRILDGERKTVARVTVISGSARSGEGRAHRFKPLLQVRSVRGYQRAYEQVQSSVEELADLAPGVGLLAVILDAVGREPGDYSSKPQIVLHAGMTAAEGARTVALALLDGIRRNEEGVLGNLDTEFLHDFRVAIRRTRSLLGQLGDLYPAAETARFKREFRWLGDITNLPRDLDVFVLDMPALRRELPSEIARHLDPVPTWLERRRAAAYRQLVRSLNGERYRSVRRDWQAFLSAAIPIAGNTEAARPVVEVSSHRIWNAYETVLGKGLKLDRSAPPGRLHKLRIECKKLRYLLEFFRSLYPAAKVTSAVDELKRLQDCLGKFNDTEVQQDWLGTCAEQLLASGDIPTATVLALGRLQQRLAEHQTQHRSQFERIFQRFARRANRQRYAELFQDRGSAA